MDILEEYPGSPLKVKEEGQESDHESVTKVIGEDKEEEETPEPGNSKSTNKKRYACKFCGMRFQWSRNKERHERKIHISPKPPRPPPSLECKFCGLVLEDRAKFKLHRAKHYKENSSMEYKCN